MTRYILLLHVRPEGSLGQYDASMITVTARSDQDALDVAKATAEERGWEMKSASIVRREGELAKAPPVPCGSCPYRKDVPSGIWAQNEYDKLPQYDGAISEQLLKGGTGAFMCHQRDGHLCGGWLACHGPRNLLALRLDRNIDPSVADYTTDVPVFESGAAARAHGIRDIPKPKAKARKMVAGLLKKRGSDSSQDGA